uniref:Uncharacterized protein n=1 Tax=Picea glauca TaxID=3330 RepID=A0A101M4N7_PICGL|nr:hypothetical protein ABT39_MTgene880 [Picea glauca]
MSHNVKHTNNPGASLSHHGLIKLFIVDALSRANQTWEAFLAPSPLSHSARGRRGISRGRRCMGTGRRS